MANTRIYSRKEISKILSKASEIHLDQSSENEEGLTESDLFKIADETGISKNALQQALLNFEHDESNEKFNWIKGSNKIQRFLTVNSDFSEDDWEKIVQEIRRITGGIGKVNKVGKSLEWEQRRREVGYKHLSLIPENGTTKIQYVYNWTALKINSMVVSFVSLFTLTSIFLGGSNFTEIPALLIAGTTGIFGIALGRFYLKSYFTKQKAQAQKLFDAISDKITKSNKSEISMDESGVFESDQESAPAPDIKSRS